MPVDILERLKSALSTPAHEARSIVIPKGHMRDVDPDSPVRLPPRPGEDRAVAAKFPLNAGSRGLVKNKWQSKVPRIPGIGEDLIPGGLADKKKPSDFDPVQLKAGMAVEREHTSSSAIAREIAMDHLSEDPNYYKKLRRMERPRKDESILSFAAGWRSMIEASDRDALTLKTLKTGAQPTRRLTRLDAAVAARKGAFLGQPGKRFAATFSRTIGAKQDPKAKLEGRFADLVSGLRSLLGD